MKLVLIQIFAYSTRLDASVIDSKLSAITAISLRDFATYGLL